MSPTALEDHMPQPAPDPTPRDAPMRRDIGIDDIARGQVSLTSPVLRFTGNPILTAADVNRVWDSPALQVVTVHNAGAAVVDGKIALLFRSHLRCGRSVLGVARSRDGGGRPRTAHVRRDSQTCRRWG